MNESEIETLDSLLRDNVGDFLRLRGYEIRRDALDRGEFDDLIEMCARTKAVINVSIRDTGCLADLRIVVNSGGIDIATSKSGSKKSFLYPISSDVTKRRTARLINSYDNDNECWIDVTPLPAKLEQYSKVYNANVDCYRDACDTTAKNEYNLSRGYDDRAIRKHILCAYSRLSVIEPMLFPTNRVC